jgi:glycosyltransferase involved in cell wall biosynthesis
MNSAEGVDAARREPGMVSFVVPAWNEEVHLARCLRSINSQVLPRLVSSVEVIVVDNESSDDTRGVAERAGARVASVAPGRASRARNAGARAATGEWLAFVDADCELPGDWLSRCVGHFGEQRVVAVGAAMRAPAAGASWVERCWYAIAHSQAATAPSRVRWLPGFNLLVRRDAFERVHGFDEQLVTCEDCDFSYRLHDLGELVFDPAPAVAHHGESQTLWQLFRREAWRSQGNLHLALARETDWRNWVSLLLPVFAILGLVAAIVGGLFAVGHADGAWLWSLGGLGLFALPFAILSARLLNRTSAAVLPAAYIVLGVYLAARSAGLFIASPRVARTSQ